ncbi:MAG: DNA polymerase III subunit delta, partial [Pseudomonadota bacterium]|nr:DNA polymerase III subunit delta [Pseudomonadota bacterium]
MKIAPKAAEQYLVAPDRQHRALLLYGQDGGLVRSRAKRAAAAVLGDHAENPFALVELEEATLLADPVRLSDELLAISMLSPKRVVIIQGGDKITGIIGDAAAHAGVQAFLVVCAGELSPRSSLRAWFEKAADCAALPCYLDEAQDIQALARQAFAAAGIRAGRGVVEYLSQQLGNDRGVTRQEIEKLMIYAGDSGEITLADAEALVDYNREANFDELAHAAADRSVQALDAMVGRFARAAASPVGYIRALMRYFNRLYYIRGQMAGGRSAEEIIAGLRPPVFFRNVPIITRHAKSWDTPQLARALQLLLQAELACKTSDLPP